MVGVVAWWPQVSVGVQPRMVPVGQALRSGKGVCYPKAMQFLLTGQRILGCGRLSGACATSL
jgi:hypothetical protein